MKLPHPHDVLEARTWLRSGAPVTDLDTRKHIQTLRAILEVLPKLSPLYAWGTKENREAIAEEPPCALCGSTNRKDTGACSKCQAPTQQAAEEAAKYWDWEASMKAGEPVRKSDVPMWIIDMMAGLADG